MPIRTARLVRIAAALLTAIAWSGVAEAQGMPMDAAAQQIADALVKAKQQSVAVFDFSGPGQQTTELGHKLADDFSLGLAKSGAKLKVTDRSAIANIPFFLLDIPLDPGSTIMLARSLSVKAFVMGELTVEQDRIHVKVSAYLANNGKGIGAMLVSWVMTDEMKALLGKALTSGLASDEFSKYPKDLKDYKPPSCLSCPRADYSPAAMKTRIQGIVELEAIVGEDGRIRKLKVIKGLPDGLTAAAIVAVSKWRLSPAIGPDGKPAAVRQVIEVNFQLY